MSTENIFELRIRTKSSFQLGLRYFLTRQPNIGQELQLTFKSNIRMGINVISFNLKLAWSLVPDGLMCMYQKLLHVFISCITWTKIKQDPQIYSDKHKSKHLVHKYVGNTQLYSPITYLDWTAMVCRLLCAHLYIIWQLWNPLGSCFIFEECENFWHLCRSIYKQVLW